MSQDSQVILCPYCGHPQSVPADQPMPDQCEECGGLFEPLSRRATQISMGPWYIRNKANPFMPGCSYDVLERMAKAGKLKPTTVLRGPTTKQFWSVARNVPGVAHLLGYCHSCGTKVSPTDAKCSGCKVAFKRPAARNELGLPFKTKAEADAAQISLDKEIAAITGMTDPGAGANSGAPAPPPPKSDLLSSVLGTGMTTAGSAGTPPAGPAGSASPFGAPNQPQQVHQPFGSPSQPTPANPTSPSPFGQPQPMAAPQQPAVGGQPGFGAAPNANATTQLGQGTAQAYNAAGQAPGAALNELEQKNKMVGAFIWGLIGFNAILIVVVVILFVVNRNDPPASAPKDNDTKDTSNKDSNSNRDSSRDGGNSSLDYTPMKIEDKPIAVNPNIEQITEPTPTVDPAVRIEVNEKLTKVQDSWATGDLRGAQSQLEAMKRDYGAAALPSNIDTLLKDLTQQIEFKEKLSTAEQHWQSGRLRDAYVVLISVRDNNYPKDWLPADFDRYLNELRKQMKDNKIEFFGIGS